MSGDFPENAFWTWSLAAYGRAEAAEACLSLQERHCLNVNVVLFCCWTASRGQPLTRTSLEAALRDVAEWHRQAVVPLRAVRQRLKGGLDATPPELCELVRQRIAAVELDAEHLEQIVLSRRAVPEMSGGHADTARLAADNLALYADLSSFDWCSDDLGPLRSILESIFPESDGATLAATIVEARQRPA